MIGQSVQWALTVTAGALFVKHVITLIADTGSVMLYRCASKKQRDASLDQPGHHGICQSKVGVFWAESSNNFRPPLRKQSEDVGKPSLLGICCLAKRDPESIHLLDGSTLFTLVVRLSRSCVLSQD